jgi:hypothetical protein
MEKGIINIDFNQSELTTLNTLFDVALKSKGIDVNEAVTYFVNKFKSSIDERNKKIQAEEQSRIVAEIQANAINQYLSQQPKAEVVE